MRPHLLCATLALFLPPLLHAQNDEKPRLGFELATTRYAASAHDGGSPSTKLYVSNPSMFTLRFTSHIGKVGIGVSAGRSVADFRSSDGGEISVIQNDQVGLWELGFEARPLLLKTPAGGRIYAHGGITYDKWAIKQVEDRSRLGLIVGMTVAGNVGIGWQVSFRVDGASSGSIFKTNDFGPGIDLNPTKRFQVGVGMSREL